MDQSFHPSHPFRRLRALGFLAMIISLASMPALAGDHGFDALVKHVESNYHVKRTRIPFLGLANFALKFVHPAGLKGFKLATFENGSFWDGASQQDFDSVMRGSLNKDWQPLLSHESKRSRERTVIYSKPAGKDLELIVAAFSQSEATLLQAKVAPETLGRWLDKPGELGRNLLGGFGSDSGVIARGSRWSDRASRDADNALDKGFDDAEVERSDSSAATNSTVPRSGIKPTANAAPGALPVLRTRAEEDDRIPEGSRVFDVVRSAGATPPARGADQPDTPLPDPLQPNGAAAAERVPAADPDAVRLEGRLVNLTIRATDRAGKIIPNLSKDDFLVYEDGVQQEVQFFRPVSAPVSLVLLLDLSGSIKEKMKVMKKAAQKFVDALRPNDQIAVAAFARRFMLVSPFTTNHKLLKDRIGDMKTRSSGTGYYDSMWETLDLLDTVKDSRRAIVVLTDGVDNYLENPKRWPVEHDFDTLLTRMSEEEDVVIYPVYLDTEYETVFKMRASNSRAYATAREQLWQVAEQTGGLLYKAARIEDLDGVYQRVASELHTLYSLAYSPASVAAAGTWHKLSVKVELSGAVARTRKGYRSK